MKYIRTDDFKQKVIKRQLDIGWEIINMFEAQWEANSPDDTNWVFTFDYNGIPLSFKYRFSFIDENLFKDNTCSELREVLEEFEDLSLLEYKDNRYDEKFLDFLKQQISMRYSNIYDEHYLLSGSGMELKKEISDFILERTGDIDTPIPFLEIYELTSREFIPKRGRGEILLDLERNRRY